MQQQQIRHDAHRTPYAARPNFFVHTYTLLLALFPQAYPNILALCVHIRLIRRALWAVLDRLRVAFSHEFLQLSRFMIIYFRGFFIFF